jgi:hypothetical protein
MMSGLERIYCGGFLPISCRYVRPFVRCECRLIPTQSHPIDLAGSHSTMLEGKSIKFTCDGEKTWENCTLESGVKIVQRVEVSFIPWMLLRRG